MKNIIPAVLCFIAFVFISCGKKNINENSRVVYWASNNTDEITFARDVNNEM